MFVLPFLQLLKEKAVSVALDRQSFRLQCEKLNVQGLWRFQFYLEEDTDLAFGKHLLSIKLTEPDKPEGPRISLPRAKAGPSKTDNGNENHNTAIYNLQRSSANF